MSQKEIYLLISGVLLSGCAPLQNNVGSYEEFRTQKLGAVVGRVLRHKSTGGTRSSGSQWCNKTGYCFTMDAPFYGKESVYFVPPGTYKFAGMTSRDLLSNTTWNIRPLPISVEVKAGQVSYLGDFVFDGRSKVNKVNTGSDTFETTHKIKKKVNEAKAAITPHYPDIAAVIN